MENYIICVIGGKLLKAPFDDCCGSRYIRYLESIVLKEERELSADFVKKYFGDAGYSSYGVLVEDRVCQLVIDDWDGYFPADLDDEKEEIQIMADFLNEATKDIDIKE